MVEESLKFHKWISYASYYISTLKIQILSLVPVDMFAFFRVLLPAAELTFSHVDIEIDSHIVIFFPSINDELR